MLWCSDPETISQIANQGRNFGKPVEHFGFFDTYGPNMQAFLGDDWKAQRKIITPAIGPHSNTAMWQSSLLQGKRLAALMIMHGPVIRYLKNHISEISLHCICTVQCFFKKKKKISSMRRLKNFPRASFLRCGSGLSRLCSLPLTSFGL